MKLNFAWAIGFGIAMIYIWNYLLVQIGARQWLWIAYLLMGFLAPAIYFGSKKTGIKQGLIFGIAFGLAASIADITLSIIMNRLSAIILIDSLLKIGMDLAGYFIFLIVRKVFLSQRKFMFSTVGIILRRIVAGVVDLQIIFIIFACMTVLFSPVKVPADIISIGALLIIFFYKLAHEIQYRQTPGKRIFGLKVHCKKAGAFIRNLPLIFIFAYQYIPQGAMNIIYAIVAIDLVFMITGKRLFDFLSGSSVVDNST